MSLALWYVDPNTGALVSTPAGSAATVFPLRRVSLDAAARAEQVARCRGLTFSNAPYAPLDPLAPATVFRNTIARDYAAHDVAAHGFPSLGLPLLAVDSPGYGAAWPMPQPYGHVAAIAASLARVDGARPGSTERRVDLLYKIVRGRGESSDGVPSRVSVAPAAQLFGNRFLTAPTACEGLVVLFKPSAPGDLTTAAGWLPAYVADSPAVVGFASDAEALATVAA